MKLPISKTKLSPVFAALALILVCSACGPAKSSNSGEAAAGNKSHVLSLDNKVGFPDGNTTLKPVPLSQAAKQLHLNLVKRGNEYLMGYTDVMYRVKPGDANAMSFGHPIKLSHAPEERNSQLYLTENAIGDLVGTQTGWDPLNHRLIFAPFPGRLASDSVIPGGKKSLRIESTVDASQVIAYAKTFIGTKYEFGSGDYDQTKTFDCSSFTQYVFKKFNVSLPRIAKDQALTGQAVDKNALKPGDLLFFTVPGRYKEDDIAGHVGIYIGDDTFIQTYGDPGVQISNLSGYWSSMMIGARRVI